MSQVKPMIGYDNLFERFALTMRASSEEARSPVENLSNWGEGTYWKAALSATIPPDEFVYLFPVTGQLLPVNPHFRDWSAGVSAEPDGWTKVGAGSSIARESTTGVKVDRYSAKLTRSGTDCYLFQSLYNATRWRGRKFTAGAWIDSDTGNRVRLALYDGFSTTYSSYHTTPGTPVFLTVTHAGMPFNSTTMDLRLQVDTGNAVGYFSGAAVVLGTSLPSTPHAQPVDYMAGHDHNLGTAAQTVKVEGSDDNWATFTVIDTVSPSTDRAFWRAFGQVSYKSYRLRFSGAAGSQRAEAAILSLGARYDWPDWIEDGFDPYARALESISTATRHGAPLSRSIRRSEIPIRLASPLIAEASVSSSTGMQAFLDHAMKNGKPFFIQWDNGDHAAQTFLAWVPEKSRFSAPLQAGFNAARIAIDAVGVDGAPATS